MPVHRIEVAIEFDGPTDDAFVALAAITGALGLDPADDVVEMSQGLSETGNQVLVAMLQPQEREDDEHEPTDADV